MPNRRRRELLTVLGAALTAGCVSDDESRAEIREIDVVNLRDESVGVSVVAERGGELVYEEAFEFGPKRGGSTDGVHLAEPWMSGEGELTVTVSVDSMDEASVSTEGLAWGRENDECVSVLCPVDENGVSLYYGGVEC